MRDGVDVTYPKVMPGRRQKTDLRAAARSQPPTCTRQTFESSREQLRPRPGAPYAHSTWRLTNRNRRLGPRTCGRADRICRLSRAKQDPRCPKTFVFLVTHAPILAPSARACHPHRSNSRMISRLLMPARSSASSSRRAFSGGRRLA
jgi:hypothetical protein